MVGIGVVAAFAAMLACPNSVRPESGGAIAASPVQGSWMHRGRPVTYFESMSLRVRGTAVSGSGTYMMEAGRRGTTRIRGTYRSRVLTLDLTRDTGEREHFSGRLAGRDSLRGTLRISREPAQPFVYTRQP
jgi:hypothetical protein